MQPELKYCDYNSKYNELTCLFCSWHPVSKLEHPTYLLTGVISLGSASHESSCMISAYGGRLCLAGTMSNSENVLWYHSARAAQEVTKSAMLLNRSQDASCLPSLQTWECESDPAEELRQS